MPLLKRRSPHQFYFDRWARNYERDLTRFGYGIPALLAQNLPPVLPAAPYILDLGIGTGLTAAALKNAMPDARISGVDVSARMLNICRSKGITDDLQTCDAGHQFLPYEAQRFDLVVASGLLEFIDNPVWLLSQAARVLKSGGLLVLAFETIENAATYRPGILGGIIQHTPECAIIRRVYYAPWPKLYNKHLHNPYYLIQIAEKLTLILADRQTGTAYRRAGREDVPYDVLIFRKS